MKQKLSLLLLYININFHDRKMNFLYLVPATPTHFALRAFRGTQLSRHNFPCAIFPVRNFRRHRTHPS